MTTYTLNLLDLFFTLHALSCGGVEGNPFMRCVPIMIFYKVIVIGILCAWLYKQNAKYALCICAAAYFAVNAWHIVNLL